MSRRRLFSLAVCAALLAGAAPEAPELRFSDLFTLPVGRRGLEPTEQLRALDGQRVRITGYVVAQEAPLPGRFLLTAAPVQLHDRESGQADDLPAATVLVLLSDDPELVVVASPAPLLLTGTLDVGARLEPDGRRSFVRLHVKRNQEEMNPDADAHP